MIYYSPQSVSFNDLKEFVLSHRKRKVEIDQDKRDIDSEQEHGQEQTQENKFDKSISPSSNKRFVDSVSTINLLKSNTSNAKIADFEMRESDSNMIQKFTFDEELYWDSKNQKLFKLKDRAMDIIDLNLFEEAFFLFFTRISGGISKIPLLEVKNKKKRVDDSINNVFKKKM